MDWNTKKGKSIMLLAVWLMSINVSADGTPNGGRCFNGWHDGWFGCHAPHRGWIPNLLNKLTTCEDLDDDDVCDRVRVYGNYCPPYSCSTRPVKGYCYPC